MKATCSIGAKEIEQVIAGHTVAPAVQPIVDMVAHARGEMKVIAYEALARFPTLADAPPQEVFDRARRLDLEHTSDLEVRLDLECIRAAVSLLPRLADNQWLSVNILPSTLADPRLRGLMIDLLPILMERMLPTPTLTVPRWRLNGTPPLVIEISEHQPIIDYMPFDNQLAELRQSRFKVAIDDLGVGDSSWWRISNLEPDILKVDRDLIEGVNRHAANRRILRAIIHYARSARIDYIIPEGVGDALDRDRLVNLGLDYGQGFFLARPMSPDEAFGQTEGT